MGDEPSFYGTAQECFNEGCRHYRYKEYSRAIEYFDHARDKTDDEDLIKKCDKYIEDCESEIEKEEKIYDEAYQHYQEGLIWLQTGIRERDSQTYFERAKFFLNKAYDLAPTEELRENCRERISECDDWLSSDLNY